MKNSPPLGYIVTKNFEKYDEGISMDEILTLANGLWLFPEILRV